MKKKKDKKQNIDWLESMSDNYIDGTVVAKVDESENMDSPDKLHLHKGNIYEIPTSDEANITYDHFSLVLNDKLVHFGSRLRDLVVKEDELDDLYLSLQCISFDDDPDSLECAFGSIILKIALFSVGGKHPLSVIEFMTAKEDRQIMLSQFNVDFKSGDYFLAIIGVDNSAYIWENFPPNTILFDFSIHIKQQNAELPELQKCEICRTVGESASDKLLSVTMTFDDVLDDFCQYSVSCYDSSFRFLCKHETDDRDALLVGLLHFTIDSDFFCIGGDYILFFSFEDKPVYKVDFTINPKGVRHVKVSGITDNVCYYHLITFYEKSMEWVDQMSWLPGISGMRKQMVIEAGRFRYNSMHMMKRSDKNCFSPVLFVIGPDYGYRSAICQSLCKLLYNLTPEVKDIGLMAESPSVLINSGMDLLGSSPAVVLYNLTPLLGGDGRNVASMLCNSLDSMDSVRPVIISGTSFEINGLVNLFPRFLDRVQLRFEVSEPEPNDALALMSHIGSGDRIYFESSALCCLSGYFNKLSSLSCMDNVSFRSFYNNAILMPYYNSAWEIVDDAKSMNLVSEDQIQLPVLKNEVPEYEAVMAGFKDMVGLDELKEQFEKMFNTVHFDMLRKEKGLPPLFGNVHHMVFTGNPGTGKSTVAALIGKIFKLLGLLSVGHVIVTERRTLVGTFIGQTERNLNSILHEARGNVLFIDEAYTLSRNEPGSNDFGEVVLQGLLTVLAEENPDMVIIFAGYKPEIDGMFQKNKGLKGRFPHIFNFPDYTVDELVQIGDKFLSQKKITMTKSARKCWLDYIAAECKAKDANFSNGRWVKQVLSNHVLLRMADRLIRQLPEGGKVDSDTFIEEQDLPGYMDKDKEKKSPEVDKTHNIFFLVNSEYNVGLN